MKFLLTAINAKYIHSNPAVYSLRAGSADCGADVEIAEYTINHRLETILQDIYEKRPDAVGISCYIWNIDYVIRLVCQLGLVLPEADIWLGGPEVSWNAGELLERLAPVSGILYGEGEYSFPALLRHYTEGRPLETVPGLYWRTAAGDIRRTEAAPFFSMDSIGRLYTDTESFANKIIYYESSRGCPFSCSYCLSSAEKTLRFRSLEKVRQDLAFFLEKRVKQVKFVDRTFNCRKERTLAIWSYIYRHDNGITNFHFEITADLLGEEELELLSKMRPGLVQLEIGVQSTNPMTLNEIDRHVDLVRLSRIVSRIHRGKNVHQHLDLIAGLPYEDYESFGRSFNDVYGLKPQQLQLGFLKVLKGTKMHRMALQYGLVYDPYAPYEVFSTKWLTFDQIIRLKRVEEMVEIYYNSNQFVWTVSCLEQLFPDAFSMYECLAAYAQENGYGNGSHARADRYGLMLRFIQDYFPQETTYFRTLLTIDYYLRENAKNRPEFMTEEKIDRETLFACCESGFAEYPQLAPYQGISFRQLLRETHIERIGFDLEAYQGRGAHLEGDFLLLFDYRKRDPLTGNAGLFSLRDGRYIDERKGQGESHSEPAG